MAGQAQAVVLTFSAPDFVWHHPSGGASPNHIWVTGDYWEQTFLNTGQASANQMDLALNIDQNGLAAGAFINLDVLINSTLVGQISVVSGPPGTQNHSFNFGSIAGPNYTIRLLETNTVPGGQGAASMGINGPSTATLVPEPASMAFLGLGALALIRKRKSRA